uniref:Amino acid transporter transmembrane domain-containing protein n=1 Tax=Clastoptera arizonana TaxID=38151 RepID=A0A1B6C5W7_9HEMI
MATTNAILKWSRIKQLKRGIQTQDSESENEPSTSERDPLFRSGYLTHFPSQPRIFYTIDDKVEVGEMAGVLFSRAGRLLFFICFSLYLFGDLSIYAVAIGKSLVDAVCSFENMTDPLPLNATKCWPDLPYTRQDAYRGFLVCFLLIFGPFAFFNVQKTKYLQLITSCTRWLAFITMITLAIRRLLDPSLPHGQPKSVVVSGFPTLLGSCIYSFMCHHSLPSLLSPISNKTGLFRILAADYILVMTFYIVLAVSAVFSFPQLQPLYTLNFVPEIGNRDAMEIVDYFLMLFPVLTLTASFPVIVVTLRNNLQAILAPHSSWYYRQILMPLLAVIPPVLLAMMTDNLDILVGVTGSYAGAGIQYLIPAFLVLSARSIKPNELRSLPNNFASPFLSKFWPILVICWALICIIFVTFNIVKKYMNLF